MKPIQWKAVDLLAAGETQEKTASTCGVCALTLRRWLKRPDFQDAMQKELQKPRELSRAQFRTIFKNTRHERTKTGTPSNPPSAFLLPPSILPPFRPLQNLAFCTVRGFEFGFRNSNLPGLLPSPINRIVHGR